MATIKKKLDMPIDRRETFTSVSKAFNDTEAMESKLHALYVIQQLDTKIDKIHLLRGELPEEVRELEDDIEGLKTRITKIQNDLKDIERFIAEKKEAMTNAKALIAKYDEQRNNVKNSREYDSLSKEIEFQGLEVELAEKRIHESTALVAEKKAYLEETKANLSGREIDLENKKKELVTIIDETSKEEEQLQKKLTEMKKNIDTRMLAAYEKVRSNARNHLAVVTVKRDACGGCFNKIPPQRQLDIRMNKKIIVCEYCGRILVSSEFEKENI